MRQMSTGQMFAEPMRWLARARQMRRRIGLWDHSQGAAGAAGASPGGRDGSPMSMRLPRRFTTGSARTGKASAATPTPGIKSPATSVAAAALAAVRTTTQHGSLVDHLARAGPEESVDGVADEVSAGQRAGAALYEEALCAYQEARFAEARELAGLVLAEDPSDLAAQRLLERCSQYLLPDGTDAALTADEL